MNVEEFRKYGKEVIDYICQYGTNIEERDVAPTLDPGYLKKLLPADAPQSPESFKDVLEDFEQKIMPGVVHWNHPKFFAYFPSGNSFPSVLGDMLSSAIGSIGFSWASCPAAAELETIVMNWYAKALGLPKAFVSDAPGSTGGGALQGSASECVLVSLITARARAISELKGQTSVHDSVFLPSLIAYASREAHSSVEKATKMALVKLRIIDADEHGRMRVDLLRQAIQNDVNAGLTPFFVVATVGTTGGCAFDDITEIGKVCRQVSSIWLHVDGAYAGNSFILPEMRVFSAGLEYADSFNTNPNKLLLTNFDASALWVRDVMNLKSALNVNPLYLRHEHLSGVDYRHYGIPLSRRFRALKLWFVFRTYGIRGLQEYIRNHMALAKKFEMLVRKDERFEVRNDVHLGLVCFRMRTGDEPNHMLLAQINHSGKMHMTPAKFNGRYVIRFCVTYEHATEKDILDAWSQIKCFAEEILRDHQLESSSVPTTPEGSERTSSEPVAPVAGKPPIKKKLTRTKSLRFSFTRSISREQYQSQSEHLMDGCTPILVVDPKTLQENFQRAADDNDKKNSNGNSNTNGTTKLKDISDVDTDEASN
ncbi:aromatic-L-amino-acid decarboxylase [Drosophila biarmipes]|uniref:aromatic-L-amino-acid decarboxylase n=1 Tax=Drosophila biarmipes TaxID=125945 RepID=UPI0007E82AF1|nr:aromatic-L-amino-acid decarboxylase [Drosophila biarmipes]